MVAVPTVRRPGAVWIGVHPHEAQEEGQRSPDRLIEATRHPKVVGIGETGLDYFRLKGDLEWQRDRFRCHIRAARALRNPLHP